jgi:hypothetical protein
MIYVNQLVIKIVVGKVFQVRPSAPQFYIQNDAGILLGFLFLICDFRSHFRTVWNWITAAIQD